MTNLSALLGAASFDVVVFEANDPVEAIAQHLTWLQAQGDSISIIETYNFYVPNEYGFGYEIAVAYTKIGDPKTGRL